MAQDTPGYFDDTGGIPWDTQAVSIGSKTFILEDFSPTEGSATQVSGDQSLVPRAARHTRTLITGSLTAQFPTGSTLSDTPPLFTVFTASYRGATKKFVVTEVGPAQKSGMETKCSCKIAEVLNATS